MKRLRRPAFLGTIALLLAAVALGADRRGPFVQPPRSVRSRDIDQQHLRLELSFNWQRREVRGRAVHTLKPFVPLEEIVLDAADMQIEQVALADGRGHPKEKKLKFNTRGDKLTIALDRRYRPDEVIRLAIDYRLTEPERGVHFVVPDQGRQKNNSRVPQGDGSSLAGHRSATVPGKPGQSPTCLSPHCPREPEQVAMVWTQSEPVDARYWFPCFDSPTDRLTSEVLVTVPDGFLVLSNGVLAGKKANPDGTCTWHWVQKQSHVTYLMSVVTGEFEAYKQQWDGIPIVSYVPRGRLAEAARSFEKTPEMVKFFSEKIGYRYPWPKYTQICVDEYVVGGMEHTSATTLTQETLHDARAELDTSSDGLVSHELAHQWWGDLLTCKDWAEVWLNEGFATYFATLWTEHDLGPDEALWRRYREAESYFSEDEGRYRRPIVTYRYQKPWDMFDRHSYPKGARVLHMLRFVLGEERFWKAIGHYCRKHAFGTVETADLRTAIEESTGQGLNWFFDQWVYHGGHPEYQVSYEWDEPQKTVRLTVKQTQKVDELTPLFRMPVDIELVTPKETTRQRILVSKAEETFHFTLPERPRRVCFDPEDWILKKLVFEKSKQEWLDQAAHDEHLICRVRAVQALAGFTKDPEVLDALARAARHDEFWGVRQEAVRALGKFSGDRPRDVLLQAARQDGKSDVRREAIKALAGFSSPQTREALREIIRQDRSYYVAAEALRTLVQVDRPGCRPDLIAAINQESYEEVILRAAADGLAELGDREAARQFLALLECPSAGGATSPTQGPATPRRRAAVMSALARLGKGDPQITQALGRQLDDPRHWVRSAACEALGETGDPAAIELLLARRNKETVSRVVRAIDDNLAKLRQQQNDLQKIRQQLGVLQKENRQLGERLKKVERALTPSGKGD
jgi:aminopeptidase N